MFTPENREQRTGREDKVVQTASFWAWMSPETEKRESSTVYGRENERKGHEDRRTETERVNKAGKKVKKQS